MSLSVFSNFFLKSQSKHATNTIAQSFACITFMNIRVAKGKNKSLRKCDVPTPILELEYYVIIIIVNITTGPAGCSKSKHFPLESLKASSSLLIKISIYECSINKCIKQKYRKYPFPASWPQCCANSNDFLATTSVLCLFLVTSSKWIVTHQKWSQEKCSSWNTLCKKPWPM